MDNDNNIYIVATSTGISTRYYILDIISKEFCPDGEALADIVYTMRKLLNYENIYHHSTGVERLGKLLEENPIHHGR